ncbi:MAG: hypothetical protein KIH08_15135, partial [Candidatus Freyarchaeota archaeon]|nr:hypothetical protein [Candidatus Jordarchaeia archaeon]MBS7250458.1 hypothetical protein [Candidatus Jordarchaeia archaeon]MBS7251904.1 hypothetical protein [Candidatus Jordarchaeia archaeon]
MDSYSQLIKEALEKPGDTRIKQKLKTWSGELPCPNCGSPSRKNGTRKYRDATTTQEYKCKN